MKSAIRPTTTANAEDVPKTTKETHALDVSEKEYNRMVSRHMMYHRVMMDDVMKLSADSGSKASPQAQSDLVAGLGSTVDALAASNTAVVDSANQKSEHGKQNAKTASRLNANMQKINAKLHNDVAQYNALMQQQQKEGFSNPNPNPNPNLDAALGNSEIVVESQKYAIVLFGVFAIYLLYKTAKHL